MTQNLRKIDLKKIFKIQLIDFLVFPNTIHHYTLLAKK